MLHILLLLLKIIGGLILILFALILLVLAVVLLVPVKYRISASRYASIEAEGHISWLCSLIEFLGRLDTGKEENQRVHIRLRIACFCIYDNQRPKKERIKKQRTRKTKKETDSEEQLIDAIGPPDADEKTADEASASGQKEADRKVDDVPEKSEKAGNKLTSIFQQIAAIPSTISKKIHAMAEKAEVITEKKDKLMAIYHDDRNHLWLTVFLGRLKRLLIRLMPRIDRLFWHFGFNDPALTGQVLGMLSVLYPLCGDRMVLRPEFCQEVMEGEIKLHGSIRVLPIVVFAVRSFLNRQFFCIVKQIKRI
ncbi:MAG: hypothetical protein ACI4BB_03490 [Coprococcus sp.]